MKNPDQDKLATEKIMAARPWLREPFYEPEKAAAMGQADAWEQYAAWETWLDTCMDDEAGDQYDEIPAHFQTQLYTVFCRWADERARKDTRWERSLEIANDALGDAEAAKWKAVEALEEKDRDIFECHDNAIRILNGQ